jgi:hypothetical protein
MSDAVENNLRRGRLSSLNRILLRSPYTSTFNSGTSAIQRPSTSRSNSMVSFIVTAYHRSNQGMPNNDLAEGNYRNCSVTGLLFTPSTTRLNVCVPVKPAN